MTLDEIRSHITLGRHREVCVDLTWISELGQVREIVFRPSNAVEIRFYSYGYDEGGIYYRAVFPTLEEAVGSVEDFLPRPLTHWENFTKTGNSPEPPEEPRTRIAWDELNAVIAPPSVRDNLGNLLTQRE